MPTAYIALGSNLGDRWAALPAAVRRLRAEPGLRVAAVSAIYESIPRDCPPGAGDFLNAVVAVETDRTPEDLLRLLHFIEHQFGRIRTAINGPRPLDLDLLLYGDEIVRTPELTLPHPRMHERDFVLTPLAEIAPNAFHPSLKKTAIELRAALPDRGARPVAPPRRASTRLAGLQALVTGSTSGIGTAIAAAFADEGAAVITHGRREREGRHIVADLSRPEECDRLANEAWQLSGGLDVLVLNAGADTLTGSAVKWSYEQKLNALLAIDVNATMRMARDLGGRMKERGRGVVLTIGWDQAETGMEGDSGQLFGAAKSAVMGFSRSLALSMAPQVRVNCIAPGWIRTAWGETASAQWQDRVRRETPLGVWGLPEDVAEAAVWLASPAASFITGQIIRVNGGGVRTCS
jgi:3-oxoacyl-[acyl-carrier protein] reductase